MKRAPGENARTAPGSARNDEEPRSATVAFLTTEHFTLQGARASTVAESTGRATMFLGSVSGGLIALGLVATATRLGTAFYAFGLILLSLLAFVGVVSFERTLQTGIEDYGYARRIARLRAYYFDQAPELLPYMLSVPPTERLAVLGLPNSRWQGWRSIAGMVAVITAALAGSAAGLFAALASNHSLAAALPVGAAVGTAVVSTLMHRQNAAWSQASTAQLNIDAETQTRVETEGNNSDTGGAPRCASSSSPRSSPSTA
jgi:hypothetical protein